MLDVLTRLRGDGRGLDQAITTRGTGTLHGAPMAWTSTSSHGSSLVNASGPLPYRAGFNVTPEGDVNGFCVDASGASGALDLVNLDTLVVSSAIAHGLWPHALVIETVERSDTSSMTLRVRARADSVNAFHLVIDAKTLAPLRLDRADRGREEGPTHLFTEHDEGMIPRLITEREGWLDDVHHVHAIDRHATTAVTSCPQTEPDDVDWTLHSGVVNKASRRHLPIIAASVDGEAARWFLLDTGAGSLTLHAHATRSQKLRQVGRRVVRTANGVIGAPIRRGTTLEIGPMRLRDPLFLEIDLAPFSRALGVKLEGVIGYDIFRRACVTAFYRQPAYGGRRSPRSRASGARRM